MSFFLLFCVDYFLFESSKVFFYYFNSYFNYICILKWYVFFVLYNVSHRGRNNGPVRMIAPHVESALGIEREREAFQLGQFFPVFPSPKTPIKKTNELYDSRCQRCTYILTRNCRLYKSKTFYKEMQYAKLLQNNMEPLATKKSYWVFSACMSIVN